MLTERRTHAALGDRQMPPNMFDADAPTGGAYGAVNLCGYVRDGAGVSGRAHQRLCHGGNAADLGPRLEGVGPGGSILLSGESIAVELA